MTTTTLTLTAFLLARIAEDEADCADLAAIGAAMSGPPYWKTARYSAECEAKRRIVELHSPVHVCTLDETGYDEATFDARHGMPCQTIAALALPYADHPDYRDEWKP